MVRFSRSNFSSNELALLNWTNDTGKMTSAMNQNYGNALVNGGAATAWLDGMTVYNYCFTGATHTYKGVGAFVELNFRYRTAAFRSTIAAGVLPI